MSPNPLSLVTLPTQLALRAAGAAVHLASYVAAQTVRRIIPGDEGDDVFERPVDGPIASPLRPEPPREPGPMAATRPDPAPPTEPDPPAPTDPVPAVVSEEPVLVAESADRGAEDGAGPEIAVAEPWPDYRRTNAEALIERIASASAAEVAVAQLYETSHRGRKTVLAAAERRLRVLNDPANR